MGLFDGLFKPKIIKEIRDGAWGHLVHDHGLTVDVLSKDIRCVDKIGVRNGSRVQFLRVFSLREAEKRGLQIAGWESFEQCPELILFEGYVDGDNQAHLERRNGGKAG